MLFGWFCPVLGPGSAAAGSLLYLSQPTAAVSNGRNHLHPAESSSHLHLVLWWARRWRAIDADSSFGLCYSGEMQLLLESKLNDVRFSSGCYHWPPGLRLLLRHIRACFGSGSPLLHLLWVVIPLPKPPRQVSVAARNLATVPSAHQHRRMARHSSLCVIGPCSTGVHYLSFTAWKRFSECYLPALLLQARVQSQCLGAHV